MEIELQENDRMQSRPLAFDAIKKWRMEIDEYFSGMHQFSVLEPDEIFMRLSSYSSRVSAIRSVVVRMENRQYTAFRTKELDPFLEECDRQFKFWSRIQSVRTLEWEITRGIS